MTLSEAQQIKARLNDLDAPIFARVVRILPEDIDPPKPKDNGWDVECVCFDKP